MADSHGGSLVVAHSSVVPSDARERSGPRSATYELPLFRAALLVGGVARKAKSVGIWIGGCLRVRHRSAKRITRSSPHRFDAHLVPRVRKSSGHLGLDAARRSTTWRSHHVDS